MNWKQPIAALVLALAVSCAHRDVKKSACVPLNYPATRKVDQVDVYHGTSVADPYRWLEDDNSAETKAWVEAENKVSFDYLAPIPQRTTVSNRLTQLWNFERWSA